MKYLYNGLIYEAKEVSRSNKSTQNYAMHGFAI